MKLLIFIFIVSYIFLITAIFIFWYRKNKIKVAESVVSRVDAHNLEVLKRFASQEIDPAGYNKELQRYNTEFGKEILKNYKKYLKFNFKNSTY